MVVKIITRGTKVLQIDINTTQLIKEYTSMSDVLKHMCISRVALKRACTNQEAYKGYVWKFA